MNKGTERNISVHHP